MRATSILSQRLPAPLRRSLVALLLATTLLVVPAIAATAPPPTATVQFGLGRLGARPPTTSSCVPTTPPPCFPRDHDSAAHAADSMVPGTVVIAAGGTVTFNVTGRHKIAIYAPDTAPEDIDVTLLQPPIPPGTINDPTARLARSPSLTGTDEAPLPWTPPAGTFGRAGRYLVICEILPHFAEFHMYGWVIAQ
jgi:hypothetical protein